MSPCGVPLEEKKKKKKGKRGRTPSRRGLPLPSFLEAGGKRGEGKEKEEGGKPASSRRPLCLRCISPPFLFSIEKRKGEGKGKEERAPLFR